MIFLALFPLIAIAFAGGFIDSDKIPQGLNLKAAISGEYSNARGDKAVVIVKGEDQPDLFAPGKYEIEVRLSADGEEILFLDSDDFDSVGKDGTIVLRGTDECDDPGCTSSESELEFRQKKDGTYYLVGKIDYTSDESEYIQEDLGEGTEFNNEIVEKYCREKFGKDAQGYFDSYVNCSYTREYQLKKTK